METPILDLDNLDILMTYPVFINLAGPDETARYFRLDFVDTDVPGPGRFVSPLELMLYQGPHFVVRPLTESLIIDRPENFIVWTSSLLLALYDPAREDAWTIGSLSGKAVFEYNEMFVVENKSSGVLDKVRRDFNSYVPVLLLARDAAGWHSKFFAADPELGVPEWLQSE